MLAVLTANTDQDNMTSDADLTLREAILLVNNAGDNRNGPTPSMKLEDYDAVAAVARGTWYLTKLVLRRFMLRQESSRIINITSVVGHTSGHDV